MTQSSVGISDGSGAWFLINASPDLPAQINSCSDLQPDSASLRSTPISGLLLTNADIDHVAGLLLMREGGPMRIHATSAVREILTECLGIGKVLDAFCGAEWNEPPQVDFSPLVNLQGGDSSLVYRAIALPGESPVFARDKRGGGTHSVAYAVMDRNTGGRLLVAPDVGAWNEALLEALQESDAVLFDGTFWSNDELSSVKANARTAADMGHLTIRDESLDRLSKLPARHKIYIHINNTNPVLSPGSSERAAVESTGVVIGHDGLEFEI
jgi:pyrroloquinoline quinone biosynthesis protein B